MAKWFTGIVPPENISNTIAGIQNKFGDNRLEPHITITPPTDVIDEQQWVQSIESVCKTFDPINIRLPGTGQFGKRVLFIAVAADRLNAFHSEISQSTKPFEQPQIHEQQNNTYNPHLTLGRKWCGFTKEDFEGMKILAEEYLQKEPVTFIASYLRIYHKPVPGGRYQLYKDVPLAADDRI